MSYQELTLWGYSWRSHHH